MIFTNVLKRGKGQLELPIDRYSVKEIEQMKCVRITSELTCDERLGFDGVKIYTAGHNINSPKFEPNGKPVIIEDNAFIFSNAMIMPGVTIGNGAIVLAGSVVTKSVPPRKIVGGNPARVLRDRTADIDYNQSYTYWFAL